MAFAGLYISLCFMLARVALGEDSYLQCSCSPRSPEPSASLCDIDTHTCIIPHRHSRNETFPSGGSYSRPYRGVCEWGLKGEWRQEYRRCVQIPYRQSDDDTNKCDENSLCRCNNKDMCNLWWYGVPSGVNPTGDNDQANTTEDMEY